MSTVVVGTVQSNSASPPTFKNTSGTEIGTLCRAFVNFNGTGTVAIRASFNVSSITDNGTGDYTVNFTTAMPDANYSFTTGVSPNVANATGNGWSLSINPNNTPTASAIRVNAGVSNGANTDVPYAQIAIFR